MDTRGDGKKGQELVEEVETVIIRQEEPQKTVKIGSKIKEGLKERLVSSLRAYADVFTWLHDDTLGIDLAIAYHKLAIRKDV